MIPRYRFARSPPSRWPPSPAASPLVRAEARPIPRAVQRIGGGIGYADLADLVLAAPVIADATIRSTTRLKGADAAGRRRRMSTRFYVEADVDRADPRRRRAAAADRLSARRRARRARPGAQVQESARAAVRPPGRRRVPIRSSWSRRTRRSAGRPTVDARIRAIAPRVRRAPMRRRVITGIGNAFHVAGALPGEGETQVFLTDRRRRAGVAVGAAPPRRAAALGGGAGRDRRRGGRPAARATRCSGIASPAPCPRALPDARTVYAAPRRRDARARGLCLCPPQLGPCGRTRTIRQ